MRDLAELGVLKERNYIVSSHLGGIANHMAKDLAHHFLVTSKSCLDLAACIVAAVESKRYQKGRMADLMSLRTTNYQDEIAALRKAPWCASLIEARDMLIHRGAQVSFHVITAQDQYALFVREQVQNGNTHITGDDRMIFQPVLRTCLAKASFSNAEENTIVEGWTVKGHEKHYPLDLDALAFGMTHAYDQWDMHLSQVIAKRECDGVPSQPVSTIFSYLDLP